MERIGGSELVKRMSELLKAGAAMLAETCPSCGSPLFRLRGGEIICPLHGKVFLVRSDEEASTASVISVLSKIEDLASIKMMELVKRLSMNNDPIDLESLSKWLEIVQRIQEIKKGLSNIPAQEALKRERAENKQEKNR
ncbi:MAG: Sjogren's syndrome/scleroderma autoantigen 1 family protein [Desulfurococcales archaeon]|nr:Sjogren's syndrome/scleroderma autoantigen 1 family protein [Desulfurococcales archaeon]